MPLAIEALDPMYAADRARVNTLAQANDLCDELAPDGRDGFGLAVDVYADVPAAPRGRLLSGICAAHKRSVD